MNTLFEGQVPTFALDTVRERVDKVNKRAIKRGFPTVTITVGQTQMVPDPYFEHTCIGGKLGSGALLRDCDEQARMVEYSSVAIAATGPLTMAGWRLVGVIAADAYDTDHNAIPMVTLVPGEQFAGSIVDAQFCAHCNTRRYRSETFLLRHDDDRLMQVGRQCIRDFLGHDPAAMLAGLDAFRELMISDSDLESWGRGAPMVWKKSEVIQAAARIVAVDGYYISKQKAIDSQAEDGGQTLFSTASGAMELLMPPKTKHDREFQEEHPYDAKAERITQNTIEALDNLSPFSEHNDWEWKLMDYAKIETVGARHIGILASSVILGLRLEERKAKAVEKPASVHQGEIGGKLSVQATLTFAREFDGQYGVTTLLKFETEAGTVQWWKSGYSDLEIGSQVTLTGTVKAHDLDKFDQRPITTMTRCKVVTA